MSSELALRLAKQVLRNERQEGETIFPQDLARQFYIPKRKARLILAELIAMGLFDPARGEGATVRSIGPQELFEIYHLCGVLEASATRLACARLDPDRLTHLRDETVDLIRDSDRGAGEMWAGHVVRHLKHIHDLLLQHCGMQRLADEISRYHLVIQTVRDLIQTGPHALLQTLHESRRLVDALLARNADRAAEMMSEYWRNVARRDIQSLYDETAMDLVIDPSSAARASDGFGVASRQW
jgi:DNA-binding GntR family transcriptional regulator